MTVETLPRTTTGPGFAVICSIHGCDKTVGTRGWCPMHYQRWRKHGDPLHTVPTAAERFWLKVNRTADCWIWMAYKNPLGYGQFGVGGSKLVLAHRFAYEAVVGPIPPGMDLDHLCRNPSCVKPAHLEPVTHRENLLRGVGIVPRNAAKTHCPQDHPYDIANTGHHKSDGSRYCRACARIRMARLKRARRAP